MPMLSNDDALGALMAVAAVAYAAVTLLIASMLVFVVAGLVATFRVPVRGGKENDVPSGAVAVTRLPADTRTGINGKYRNTS